MTDSNLFNLLIKITGLSVMTPIPMNEYIGLNWAILLVKSIIEFVFISKLILSIVYYLTKFTGILFYSFITLKISQLKDNLENPLIKIVQRNFYMSINSYLNYLLIIIYLTYVFFNLNLQVKFLFLDEVPKVDLFNRIELIASVYLFIFLEKYFVFYIILSNSSMNHVHFYKAAFAMIYTIIFFGYNLIVSIATLDFESNQRLGFVWAGAVFHLVLEAILYSWITYKLFVTDVLRSKWNGFIKMKRANNFLKFETIDAGFEQQQKLEVSENEMNDKLNLSQTSTEILNLHKTSSIDNDPSDMLIMVQLEDEFIEESLIKSKNALSNIKFYEHNDSVEAYYYSKSKLDGLTYLKTSAILILAVIILEIGGLINLILKSSTSEMQSTFYFTTNCVARILIFFNFWYIFMKLEYRSIYLLQ